MTINLLPRPAVPALDAILGHTHPVLDHGFVRIVDYMGDDAAIVQAARVSYGAGTESPSSDTNLIHYLMRHRHTTPFEMCELKLHVKLPIFVARQWVRHRTASINEMSARYSVLAREFYIPESVQVQRQSTTNKQGRAGVLSPDVVDRFREVFTLDASRAFDAYEAAGAADIARETARMGLPVSTYTEWYWKVNLHNLLHFLSLRADPHAQHEIQVYADVILDIVRQWVPATYAAFDEHRLGAVTFSRSAMAALRQVAFAYENETVPSGHESIRSMKPENVSKREWADFLAALGLSA